MTLVSDLLLYRLQTQTTSCYLLSQDSQVNGLEANKLTFEQCMQNVKASKLQIIQFCRIELDTTVRTKINCFDGNSFLSQFLYHHRPYNETAISSVTGSTQLHQNSQMRQRHKLLTLRSMFDEFGMVSINANTHNFNKFCMRYRVVSGTCRCRHR